MAFILLPFVSRNRYRWLASRGCISRRNGRLGVQFRDAQSTSPSRPDSLACAHSRGNQRASSRSGEQTDPLDPSTIIFEETTPSPERLHVSLRSLGGRRRLISGSLRVPVALRHIWDSLTSFHEMDQFVPHIISSSYDEKLERLEQVALVSRRLQLRSRVVMNVRLNREAGEIWFTKHESRDFSEWCGVYRVVAEGERVTRLEYELDVVPMLLFPVALVERKILKEVPRVLRAFADRALQREQDV